MPYYAWVIWMTTNCHTHIILSGETQMNNMNGPYDMALLNGNASARTWRNTINGQYALQSYAIPNEHAIDVSSSRTSQNLDDPPPLHDQRVFNEPLWILLQERLKVRVMRERPCLGGCVVDGSGMLVDHPPVVIPGQPHVADTLQRVVANRQSKR